MKKPYVLTILDGWGEGPASPHNAISLAKTPHWDALKARYPFTTLDASGHEVGLPPGQMGNSEVGHMNIGAGRIILQDLPRIDEAIGSGALKQNPELKKFIAAHAPDACCHLMGLLSPGGVHSHASHILELIKILNSHEIPIIFHAFLDGRDTPPRSAHGYMQEFLEHIKNYESVAIGTIGGRYYGMDRDNRWERIEKAYKAIRWGEGPQYASPLAAIEDAYNNSISDEFILPTVIKGYKGIKPHSSLLMANFRADRVREILTALTDPAFQDFRTAPLPYASLLGMMEYSEKLNKDFNALFPPQPIHNTLGEMIEKRDLKQLRAAETEKYAHVTFFFNGGREAPFKGEERLLIPSPHVATYDLKPEMSAYEMTAQLIEKIKQGKYDFIVANYANADMVGHTGDLKAAIRAAEAVDDCLGALSKAVLEQDGVLFITADHGNAEFMFDEKENSPHTAHTCNLVPFFIIGSNLTFHKLNRGILADIAPTILTVMGLDIPPEMSGRSLAEA